MSDLGATRQALVMTPSRRTGGLHEAVRGARFRGSYGARCLLLSTPGRGTCIRVEIPATVVSSRLV